MPGSMPKFKTEVARHVRGMIGDGMRVLDVGPGCGTWADLLGHCRLDAIEAHAPYVTEYALTSKYRTVYVGDVRSLDPGRPLDPPESGAVSFDYAILGDVLEHLPVPDAQRLVQDWTSRGVKLLVAVPYLNPQDAAGGVEWERHLQDDLTPVVMAERYPELRLLIGDGRYGYFVNYDTPRLRPDAEGSVAVCWWEGQREYWDHGLLMAAVSGDLWPTSRPFVYREVLTAGETNGKGCILALPGRGMAGREAEVAASIRARAWTLAAVLSDEESRFDAAEIAGPTARLAVQTPAPGLPGDAVQRRKWPLGWRTDTRASAAVLWAQPPRRDLLWSFAGQVNHSKREECVRWLKASAGPSELHASTSFGVGLAYPAYLGLLARSALAPSPSGPFTPDCFRTWEALELGCLPVADRHSPVQRYPGDYYSYVLGEEPPFPRVESWAEFPPIAADYAADPARLGRDASRAFASWQRHKRQFVLDLEDDVHAVSGLHPYADPDSLRGLVTVVITASPVPSHPSTEMVEEMIRRVRAYPELAESEVLVLCDGVRPEQEHRRADYEEHLRRLLWRCNWMPELRGVLPVLADQHLHQAELVRRHIDMVRTPLVLFVEHDTWPTGRIEWITLAKVVEEARAGVKVARLQHYGGDIHPEHRYLLVDGERRDVGVPIYRTLQWSQRPHLARTDFYRRLLADHFRPTDRTMIEDVMHGVAQGAPWERFGVAVYAPPGDMQRSDTCDGRGADPKFPMEFGR